MEKGVALLSGGIDSPVAIHLLKERMEIIAVHFHQIPLTDGREVEKCRQLVQILNINKLYLVPFADVLKQLVENGRHRHYFVLSKIMMLKAAEIIAGKEGAKYLITGENLAQVSSQTLQNLSVITKQIKMEIFRPVLTYDKQEIIDTAREIGTLEISSGPEMCNLLGPKNPATRVREEEITHDLAQIDTMRILAEALQKAEIMNL